MLTVQYGFPYLPLGNYDISPDVIKLVPIKIARDYHLIPIDKIGSKLSIEVTPTVIFPDGAPMNGMVSAADINRLLNSTPKPQ